MIKLSVITINYNNLEGLKRTVDSVVNQIWKEFEYIVIDGGSTDGSKAYLESQTNKIDYWVSAPDLGIYNAMNKGVKIASGEYLLFLNSGDLLYNNSVLDKNLLLLHTQDLICFDILIRKNEIEYIKSSPETNILSYLALDTFPHQSTLIKKKLFDVVGLYDEKLKIVSDWKFLIFAIIFHKASYKKINQVLSIYYLDGISSDSSNHTLMIRERHEVLNSYLPYIKELFEDGFEKERLIKSFRKSSWLKVLVKLGLLNKF